MLSDETLMRDDIVRRYPFHRGNYTMQGNKVVSRNGTPPIETDQYTCLENSLYFGQPLMLLEQVILKFSSADGWCPYNDTLANQTFTVKMASRWHGRYDLSWQEQQILKTADVQTTVIIEVNDFPSAVNGRVGRPRTPLLGKFQKFASVILSYGPSGIDAVFLIIDRPAFPKAHGLAIRVQLMLIELLGQRWQRIF